MFIYICYQIQVFIFMTLIYILGSNRFLLLYIFTIHLSFNFLNINIFLYFWFILSCLHYYIHEHITKLTIIETNKTSLDELWHIINPMFVMPYLYINKLRYDIYIICGLFYYIYVFKFIIYKKNAKELYFIGSSVTAVFIILVENINFITGIILFMFQIYFSWIITFNNKFGRLLIKLNVAGCSFISEFIIIYLIYNKINNLQILFSFFKMNI